MISPSSSTRLLLIFSVLLLLPAAATAADTPGRLKLDLQSFAEKRPELAPEAAATEWLALVHRFGELRGKGHRYDSFAEVAKLMPPPETWDAIAAELRKIPAQDQPAFAHSMHLLASTLTSSERDQLAAFELLVQHLAPKAIAPPPPAKGFIRSILASLREVWSEEEEPSSAGENLREIANYLTTVADDREVAITAFQRQVQLVRDDPESYSSVEVPDLVTLAGPERAGELLRPLILGDDVAFELTAGEETRKLARRIALQEVRSLKVAQWELVDGIDAGELYEALEKRFGKQPEDYSWRNAASYYLLALITRNETDKATALLLSMQPRGRDNDFDLSLPYDALHEMQQRGYTSQVHAFLREVLQQRPELPLWDQFAELSTRLGETEEMIEMARKVATDRRVLEKTSGTVARYLFTALLAADRLDEAEEAYQQAVASLKADKTGGTLMELHVKWLQANLLLQNEERWEAALRNIREALKDADFAAYDYQRDSALVQAAEALEQTGRAAEAAELLQQLIDGRTDSKAGSRAGSVDRELTTLASIHLRNGNAAEALKLIDSSAHWSADDLAYLLNSRGSDDPLGYIVAAALAREGKQEQALEILGVMITASTSHDPVYKLFIELEQQEQALQALDAAYQQDPFEERPLIWKAELQRQQGNLMEAESTIRQAIAIDPSDGEIGRDHRMHAYVVLGAIAAEQGRGEEATLMKNIEESIRHSELADRFHSAGLLSRSIAMYKEALEKFADAYCIQSRLALQLTEQGRIAEAAEHYRRAYELMPDSFGRIESHCFGCEGAFGDPKAQTIAEEVFTRFIENDPAKPQLHYLLGYLRMEQGKPEQALPLFRKAVELDPDYLSAWKQLESLGSSMRLPSADRNRAAFNLYRLDPLARHSSPDLELVTDLRGLWETVQQHAAAKTALPKKLYPLRGGQRSRSPAPEETRKMSPGEAMAKHSLIQQISSLLNNGVE